MEIAVVQAGRERASERELAIGARSPVVLSLTPAQASVSE